MAEQFSVVFRGEVIAGCKASDVQAEVASRFKKSDEIVQQLFDGRIHTLASNIAFKHANTLANSLKQIGAVAYVVDARSPKLPARRTPVSVQAAPESSLTTSDDAPVDAVAALSSTNVNSSSVATITRHPRAA